MSKTYEAHVHSRANYERVTTHFVDSSGAIKILKGRTNAGEVLVYDEDGEIVGRRWKLDPSAKSNNRFKWGWFFYTEEIKLGNGG